MLQYNNEEKNWLRIAMLERGRHYHAIVEANLAAVCSAVGNLNPIKKSQEIIIINKSIILKAGAPQSVVI